MSGSSGPDIITDSLLFHVDAANSKSYPGSGTTWYDLSGNRRHLTLTNASFTSDLSGGFYFGNFIGGVYATASSTTTFSLSSGFSISVWIKHVDPITSIQRYVTLPSEAAVLRKGAGTNNTIESYVFDTSGVYHGFTNTTALSGVGIVHNFVMTCDGTGTPIMLYVNGTFQAQTVPSAMTLRTPTAIQLGSAASTEGFLGNMYVVSLYNKVLSANEIQQNFYSLRGRFGI